MVLDVCVKLPARAKSSTESVRRTTLWARRSAAARQRGRDGALRHRARRPRPELRERSARELVALDFPGYAIGGLSVGETREEMYATARAHRRAVCRQNKPRYLMGVGTVRDLIAAVDCGIDMFDCVYPTRCGRNGRAMTRDGRIQHPQRRVRDGFAPVDAGCGCTVCATFTRAYLAHLFRSEEMLGPRLLSYHNVYVLNALMRDARAAIEGGDWTRFRDRTLRV